MFKFRSVRENISQILAITEKNIKLQTRFKLPIIFGLINPIISIILPLILMGNLFAFNNNFGPWTAQNFIVYQFLAYHIILLRRIISVFPQQFRIEKYWKTLPALIVGPFTRFNLLFGIFFAHLIMMSIPFTMIFVLNFMFYPISFVTALTVIGLFFLIALIMSGVGLILGIFAVSSENLWTIVGFGINLVFWFSCITFPYEIFPEVIQNIINLNPLYYIFDLLRLTWIENNILTTFALHQSNLLILIISAIILPFIGVYIFNITYKKFGITGY